jgi:hypothetical protein
MTPRKDPVLPEQFKAMAAALIVLMEDVSPINEEKREAIGGFHSMGLGRMLIRMAYEHNVSADKIAAVLALTAVDETQEEERLSYLRRLQTSLRVGAFNAMDLP